MNKEKYYTPDISEFHVGFEYEQITTNYPDKNNWQKAVVRTERDSPYQLWITNGTVRVKHLDQEDIESLGFEHCSKAAEFDVFERQIGGRKEDLWTIRLEKDRVQIHQGPRWYGSVS